MKNGKEGGGEIRCVATQRYSDYFFNAATKLCFGVTIFFESVTLTICSQKERRRRFRSAVVMRQMFEAKQGV